MLAENQDRIYRICCCYVRDVEERNDVYQTVLLQLWKNLGSFAGRSSLATWIYRVTVNVCLGQLRNARRHQQHLCDAASPAGQRAIETALAPEPSSAPVEEIERLYACVRQLPEVDRTLVSLYLEDASAVDMGEVLGISEAHVRVKLHRIKKRLKHLWEATDDTVR